MTTSTARTLLIGASAAGLLLAAAVAYRSWPNDEGAAGSEVEDPKQVLAYWTVARMREAANIDGPADFRPSAPPLGGDEYGYIASRRPYKINSVTRVTGVLFSYNPVVGKDTHCSASIIRSRSQSVIITAAHCFISYNPVQGGKNWSEKMLFVPAYDGTGINDLNELAPFGAWPVHRAYITRKTAAMPMWATGARDDLGLASIVPQAGKRLEAAVGGGFEPLLSEDQPLNTGDTLGYPAGRYNGYSQYHCATTLPETAYFGVGTPNCGIVGGHSGGPVIVGNQIVAVIHGAEQTRLRPDTYPSLAAAADGDFPQGN